MPNARKLLLLLLFGGAVTPAVSAAAAVFQIFPVLIEAPADAPTGVVTLSNGSAEPVMLQLRIFRWTQVGGRDVLTPTSDVVASPPAAKIEPGRQQVVRVVRTAKAPAATEEAYRLIVDEIPVAKFAPTHGVRMMLRQSVPVFFGSNAKAAPRVEWRIERTSGGWELAALNKGPRRQRISDLEIRDEAGRLLDQRLGLVGYVLGNSEARWTLNFKEGATVSAKLIAASDAGAVHADLTSLPTP